MFLSFILTAKFRLKCYHQRAAFLQQVCALLLFIYLTFITASDPPSPQHLPFPAFHCRYKYNLMTYLVYSRLHRFNLNHCSTLWYKLVSHQMTAQTRFTFKLIALQNNTQMFWTQGFTAVFSSHSDDGFSSFWKILQHPYI